MKKQAIMINPEEFYNMLTQWDSYRRDVCHCADPNFSASAFCVIHRDEPEYSPYHDMKCSLNVCPKRLLFLREAMGAERFAEFIKEPA
jgi:hypothetical protein